MRPSLFVLPFFALLVATIGGIVSSAFPHISWVKYAGLGAAAAILGLWISLDFEGFKRVFKRKGSKYGASAGIVVVLGILVIVGVAFLTSKPTFNKSYDVTKNKVNTLAEQSSLMVKNIKEKNLKVEVTGFFTDDAQSQAFKDMMDRYQKLGNVFTVQTFNPQSDPSKAAEFNITSENSIIFRAGEQEARVSTVSEEKITNALAKIMKGRAKKVYFLQGHGEPELKAQNPEGFSLIVAELENNKFEVNSLSLLEKPEIPKDADMLVIAGPKYDLKAAEASLVEQYLKNGGALFIAVDGGIEFPVIKDLATKSGITINDDFLILPPNDLRVLQYGRTAAVISNFDETNPATRDFARKRRVAIMTLDSRTVAAADSNPLSLKPTVIAKTSADSLRISGVKSQKDLAKIDQSRISQGEFGVIAVSSGKAAVADVAAAAKDAESKTDSGSSNINNQQGKEIRVAVSGTAKFIADQVVGREAQNLDMFMNVSNYLVNEEDFIAIKAREPDQGKIDVSSGWSQLFLMCSFLVYPAMFLGGGVIYWLFRRKA